MPNEDDKLDMTVSMKKPAAAKSRLTKKPSAHTVVDIPSPEGVFLRFLRGAADHGGSHGDHRIPILLDRPGQEGPESWDEPDFPEFWEGEVGGPVLALWTNTLHMFAEIPRPPAERADRRTIAQAQLNRASDILARTIVVPIAQWAGLPHVHTRVWAECLLAGGDPRRAWGIVQEQTRTHAADRIEIGCKEDLQPAPDGRAGAQEEGLGSSSSVATRMWEMIQRERRGKNLIFAALPIYAQDVFGNTTEVPGLQETRAWAQPTLVIVEEMNKYYGVLDCIE